MTDIDSIAKRTGAGVALAFRSGETTPTELTDHLLGRIERSRADNIFITVTAERARREAEAATRRYRDNVPLSPLDGVPIAWKDLFHVAGTRTTAGSKLLADSPVRERDMPCVANAAAAGMVCMGKLNMTEFAYSGLGLNPHYGTAVNPHGGATRRAPGGSSSGSGTAVASGLVPIAIGTDTGGSVRIPAAFNGIVGFKTSTGRIAKHDLIPLSRTLDTIGPLARSVEDCILADMLMRGAVASPVRRGDLRSLVVVAPQNGVMDGTEPAVLANYERSLEALARAGATIRRDKVPALDRVMELTAQHGSLTAAEAYAEYQEMVDSEKAKQVDRRVIFRMLGGKRMSALDVLTLQRGRAEAMRALALQLDGALLSMPTTPHTAPAVAPLEADDELFHAVNLKTLRNTAAGNMLDLCGVALPNGRDGDGLPTSILFSAVHGEDTALLGLALAIEPVVAGAAA